MTDFNWAKEPTDHLNIQGKKLEYACYGPAPGEASTIIMLHEGLGCVELWRDFPQKLSDATGCGVFVFSRAGYGQSDPTGLPRPVTYMTDEAVNILPQVLDVIGFKTGLLLGHSDGATIVAIYGGSIVDHRVRSLILIAPHFFTEPSGLATIKDVKSSYETGDLKQRLSKYHKDVDNAFYGWNDIWLHSEFKDWDVSDVIDYWRIPVLVFQGNQDPYGTNAQITEIETRIYSPLELVMLDDCFHLPQFEKPSETLGAITEFMNRLKIIEAA